MALIFRLAGKRIGPDFFKNYKTNLLCFVRPATAKAVEECKEETYDERNMKLKRPLSPHLRIYRAQLTTVLSLAHRTSGIILATYLISFGLGAVALPDTIPAYIEELECMELSDESVIAMKFVLAFPLCYHFWNGLRFLLWDMGAFLSKRMVYVTGYTMLLLAFGSAITVSFM